MYSDLAITKGTCRICPEEMCIALNKSAEYNLARGVGKRLSVRDALLLEKEARKYNLIIPL